MPGAAKDDKILRVFLKSHSIHCYSSISSPLYSSPFDWLTRENVLVLEAVGDPSRYQKLLPWES
ncbi:hypothetical protein DY000_02000196 [Brassica cretica]|uniref:Uncharacterized protein n=1 Tax=Brassica cretica TaxID=69181 RepID=A0ABQ7BZW7_BRACR|nr:hypothetical protein DY000_02000196 [Brassica cretica]